MLAEATEVTTEAASSLDPAQSFAIALGLLIVSLLMVFAEILFPSFGLLTILAVGALIGGAAVAFSISNTMGIIFIVIAGIALPLAIFFGLKLLQKTKMILSPEDATAGSSEVRIDLSPGARGVAVTVLRPSGTAKIDGKKYSVVTTGDLIDKNAQIEVVSVDPMKITVKAVRV